MNDDKLLKFLHKCNLQYDSFTAMIKGGSVFVDCRGYQIYVKSNIDSGNETNTITQFAGPMVAAANRLEMLGIDLGSIKKVPEGCKPSRLRKD